MQLIDHRSVHRDIPGAIDGIAEIGAGGKIQIGLLVMCGPQRLIDRLGVVRDAIALGSIIPYVQGSREGVPP